MSKTVFLSGDEAIGQGAYEASVKVACSYPGTPATQILEYLAQFNEVDAQWSVNEKVAFEVALGAAIAGVRSLYSSKHVGVNVAMDPLMTSSYVGVNAGFVIISCDDPGIHSSQNEQDNRLLAKIAKIPLLEPASPSEAYLFVKKAFDISEQFDIPVMIRMTTRIAHTKESFTIKGIRKEIPTRQSPINVSKYVMVPRNAFMRHIELEKRIQRLKAFSEKTPLNRIEINNRRLGFITSGVTYLYAKQMYPDASFLKLGFSFPFPYELARRFAKEVKNIYVIEELEPYMEEQLILCGIKAKAKDPTFRVGELRPEDIPRIVAQKKRDVVELASRKPVMCPGCPHRAVFSILRKLRLTVTGDIGCYTLGALAPLAALHTCLCMGAAVTFFEGFNKAGKKNIVAVIGDSTFVHSGITGLINAAYNHTKGVIVILDNATTAMTGSQPHPAVGIDAKGRPTKKLILEDLCRVCGADYVDVVASLEVKRLEELIRQRLEINGLSVIIVRTPCRLLQPIKQGKPDFDAQLCKRCYLCLSISCPALLKDEQGLISIEPNLCVGCDLCVEICPSRALKSKNE